MSTVSIRPMVIGEVRNLGAMLPGLCNENAKGTVVEILAQNGVVVVTLDVRYMGVRLGEAYLTQDSAEDAGTGIWTWA